MADTNESIDNKVVSPLDEKLKKIEKKDFSMASFDANLDKELTSPENSKKLFDATKSSLQNLEEIKTGDQANNAKKLLNWCFDKLPKDVQTAEKGNLDTINANIDARIKSIALLGTISAAVADPSTSQSLEKVGLFDKEAVKEDVQKTFNEVIKQFGGALLSIFELFGGKGALKSFCTTFHLDYDTHFASIEKLYTETYQLGVPQSSALNTVYASSQDELFADKIKGTDNKEGWSFQPKKVQDYYADPKWLDPNFNLLDPVLIQRAMKKNPAIAIPNLIVSSGSIYGEKTYKINENIPVTGPQKQAIFTELTKDPSLWSSVNALGGPDIATKVYGKENINKNQLWNPKKPTSPREKAVAYGACLMKGSTDLKYVLSQSDMPYEADKSQTKTESSTTPETPEAKIKAEWTTFFATAEGNDRKDYPLADDKVTQLSGEGKTKYDAYKKTVSEKVLQLLDPNKKADTNSVLSDTSLKAKVLSFLTKHFPVYLASLPIDAKMYTKNKQAIDGVSARFKTITSTPSFEFTDANLSIKGKDSSTPPKDVEIKNTELSWLPILKTTEVATNKNTKTKKSK